MKLQKIERRMNIVAETVDNDRRPGLYRVRDGDNFVFPQVGRKLDPKPQAGPNGNQGQEDFDSVKVADLVRSRDGCFKSQCRSPEAVGLYEDT